MHIPVPITVAANVPAPATAGAIAQPQTVVDNTKAPSRYLLSARYTPSFSGTKGGTVFIRYGLSAVVLAPVLLPVAFVAVASIGTSVALADDADDDFGSAALNIILDPLTPYVDDRENTPDIPPERLRRNEEDDCCCEKRGDAENLDKEELEE